MASFMTLTDTDLKELGITTFGARRKLLLAISGLSFGFYYCVTLILIVKEGPADCIRMAEVRAVLKKMKRHKAPGLSGLLAEMIQATGDIGTQWILDLCKGIVKEGSIPENWNSSMVLPIYKGKGDPMECGSYNNNNNNDRLTAFDPGQPG